MSTETTRRRLYAMVWSQPVTKVAESFSVSDVAIHKICRKNNIPTPPPGYWAKKKAGKRVNRPPLSHPEGNQNQTIQILGSVSEHSEAVRAACKKSKAAKIKTSTEAPVQKAADIRTSSYVDELKVKLAKARPNRDGLIILEGNRQFRIKISPNTTVRTVAAIGNIVNEALIRGYEIEPSEEGLAILIDEELVAFTVAEIIKRAPHELTEKEQARLKRWEQKRDREFRARVYSSVFDRPEFHEFDYLPTGHLAFEFVERRHCSGLRRRYADGKRQRVEKLADKIITAAAGYAAAIKEGKEKDARRKRKWEEQERIRKEWERRQRLENKRFELLESKLERIKLAETLQEFVSKYEAIYPREIQPESSQMFLDWALKTIEEVHKEIHPEKLAAILEKHSLMDDDTDIHTWTKLD